MTAHVEAVIVCDGQRCNANWTGTPPSPARIVGSTVAEAESKALAKFWIVTHPWQGERQHLCPLDAPGAKCQTAPLSEYTHLGPWERIPKTDSLSRCLACGHVSGK